MSLSYLSVPPAGCRGQKATATGWCGQGRSSGPVQVPVERYHRERIAAALAAAA
jgi:hypothetical protein